MFKKTSGIIRFNGWYPLSTCQDYILSGNDNESKRQQSLKEENILAVTATRKHIHFLLILSQ